MIYELDSREYERVRPLLAGLSYQLISAAVVDGTSPGRIWVDHPEQPGTALMASAEGYLLAGSEHNATFNQALSSLITDIISQKGLLPGDDAFSLVCHPDTWESQLGVIFSGRSVLKEPCRHYLLDRLLTGSDSNLPEGYTLVRIDETLLERPDLIVPEHITGWMNANWGSVDDFLQRGFGFCTVHSKQPVCWCLSDCVSGQACEIGIHTATDYRRRGLATLTVTATVNYCLTHGLTTIGWHCHENNLGSRRVAEKVGFKKERSYVDYVCIYEETERDRTQGTAAQGLLSRQTGANTARCGTMKSP